MPDNLIPGAILCLPFAAAAATWLMRERGHNSAAWLMTGAALLGLALSLWLAPAILAGEVLRQTIPWAPSLGLDLVLRVDGFSWLMLLLICGIGALVGVYARFFALLLAFMGSMLGIVMSGNVIQLVFFWELTSLFSFLLIGYWHHGASA